MGSRTSSSIQVAAPTADVMGVIADFGQYPQWATALKSAEVLQSEPGGKASRVRFCLDAGLIRDTYTLAYTWDGDTGVSWQLAEPGSVIAEMTGGYHLSDRGSGTEVNYELTVDVRIPMPGLLKRKAEKVIIDTALKGLKARAESLGNGRSAGSAQSAGGAR
jgi:carbon monoxide dehydrogenase subunit G